MTTLYCDLWVHYCITVEPPNKELSPAYVHIRNRKGVQIVSFVGRLSLSQRVSLYRRSHLQLFTLQNKLNSARLEYLALKMNSEEEILSLKQQVQTMQKVFIYTHLLPWNFCILYTPWKFLHWHYKLNLENFADIFTVTIKIFANILTVTLCDKQ